jgi:UDP-2-acetamido-3-amino-2,3-dideoxy-glucuronate N-acetyltransferase
LKEDSQVPGKALMLEVVTVPSVKVLELPLITDPRGSLSYGQYSENLPFIPKRYFIVFDVPGGQTRGGHAHRSVDQFLVCVRGSCTVSIDDGRNQADLLLDSPTMGVYIPPIIWATQHRFSTDAVLLVLASDIYDPDEYIREYSDFKRMIERR